MPEHLPLHPVERAFEDVVKLVAGKDRQIKALQAEVERLKAENNWVRSEMQSATVALGRDDGDHWEVHSFNCAVDTAVRRLSDLQAEVERMKAIVAKLPKTADGVPVVPGMTIFEPPDWTPFVASGVSVFPDCPQHNMYAQCYSTLNAAEAEGHNPGPEVKPHGKEE